MNQIIGIFEKIILKAQVRISFVSAHLTDKHPFHHIFVNPEFT